MSSTQTWVDRELSSLDLNDKRRDRRIRHMVARMADAPGGSILQMFQGHAEAAAAYRALSSEAIDPEAILAAMQDACLERVKEEKLILALQDTTTFNFTSHPATSGTGPLADAYLTGFLFHDVLAVSGDGVPLGLLHWEQWARDPEAEGTRHQRSQRPFEEKESFRWLASQRAVQELAPQDTTVVTVADRECDIYEVFAESRPDNCQLLIRSCYDRCLSDDERRLRAALEAEAVSGEFTVALRRHPNRKQREANMEVRFRTVSLNPPHYRVEGTEFEPVTVNAILVTEVSPPEGETPVSWTLLTTLPVSSLDEARSCVRFYCLRWLIERYHYVLKSGCKIEESQLRDANRLMLLLALYCVVAWRLLWITYSAREDGDQPCTIAFTDLEWRVAYRARHGDRPLPDKVPTLRELVREISGLGGFLGRKSDGEPGAKVLWRGLMRLQDIVLGVRIASDQDVCKV